MRIGVLTGGGDCPGLNAVIRAIVRAGEVGHNDEVRGFLDSWDGVMDQRFVHLDVASVRGLLPRVERSSAPAVEVPTTGLTEWSGFGPASPSSSWTHWS